MFEGTGAVAGKALLGGAAFDLGTGRFACRNCHRRDGAGGQEGRAPPIVWSALSRPDAKRPAYDRAGFATLLREGIRPDDTSLDPTMPHYDLPDATIDSLVAYLKALPDLQRRGIANDSLTFGIVMPPDNRQPSELYARYLEEALKKEMAGARFFGRRVVLKRLDGMRDAILREADGSVAAIVGLSPSSQLKARDFSQIGVPVLFPVGLLEGDEDTSLVKGIVPSLGQQLEALIKRAIADGNRRIGLIGAEKTYNRQNAPEITPLTASETIRLGDFDAFILAGNDPVPTSFLRQIPAGTRIYGVAGQLPDLPALAERYRFRLTLASGYDPGDAGSGGLLRNHAQTAAALLKAAVLSMGRAGATRAALITAFERTRFPDQRLDFSRFPLTGSDDVRFFSF